MHSWIQRRTGPGSGGAVGTVTGSGGILSVRRRRAKAPALYTSGGSPDVRAVTSCGAVTPRASHLLWLCELAAESLSARLLGPSTIVRLVV